MPGIGSLAVQVTAFSAEHSRGSTAPRTNSRASRAGIASLFGGITAQLDVGAAISSFVNMVQAEMEFIDATAKLPDSRTAARIIEVVYNAHARRKFYEVRQRCAAVAPGVGLLPPTL